jgi:HD-GYP domain-containing protein (c-di-GMP phosphodiesterase class II)
MPIERINTEQLQVGMYVSRLDRPWRETPFLFQGFYIQDSDEIAKLREICRHVYIVVPDEEYTLESESAQNEPTELSMSAIDELVNGHRGRSETPRVKFVEELPKAQSVHESLENLTIEIWSDLDEGKALNIDDINEAVDVMVDSIKRNPDAFNWVCRVKEHHSSTYRHALNVSAGLTTFGRNMGFDDEQLRLLAMGGLCLDIGNIKLPQDLLDKEDRLTDDEWELVKKHVRYGMDLLQQASNVDERLLWMVATHHERYDGSGYLAELVGDRIPVFGQMAGIVDSYVASTESKPYASAMTPEESIQTLFKQRDQHFKLSLVDRFIQSIGIYPTGSLVELSSGEIAIIVGQNPRRRLRPRVVLLLDADKNPYGTYPMVNLVKETHTFNGKPLEIVKGVAHGEYPISLEDLTF